MAYLVNTCILLINIRIIVVICSLLNVEKTKDQERDLSKNTFYLALSALPFTFTHPHPNNKKQIETRKLSSIGVKCWLWGTKPLYTSSAGNPVKR